MFANGPRFRDLIKRAAHGSPDALAEIVATHSPRLLQIARRKLARALHSIIDTEDIVQEVWLSFIGQGINECRFTCNADLVRFLNAIVRRRIIDANRHYLVVQKENMRRERSLNSLTSCEREKLTATEPAAETVVEIEELFQRLLDRAIERARPIIEMRQRGFSFSQIAHEIGLTERSARRLVESSAERNRIPDEEWH